MRRIIATVLCLIPAVAHGQVQVGLNLGLRTRTDAGQRVNGTQLEGMIIAPHMGNWTPMALLAFTQMRNSWPTGGAVRRRLRERWHRGHHLRRHQVYPVVRRQGDGAPRLRAAARLGKVERARRGVPHRTASHRAHDSVGVEDAEAGGLGGIHVAVGAAALT